MNIKLLLTLPMLLQSWQLFAQPITLQYSAGYIYPSLHTTEPIHVGGLGIYNYYAIDSVVPKFGITAGIERYKCINKKGNSRFYFNQAVSLNFIQTGFVRWVGGTGSPLLFFRLPLYTSIQGFIDAQLNLSSWDYVKTSSTQPMPQKNQRVALSTIDLGFRASIGKQIRIGNKPVKVFLDYTHGFGSIAPYQIKKRFFSLRFITDFKTTPPIINKKIINNK
ncbi:MAG: hypothetical protein IPN94_13715 [Sphingobacteriales bacterium]|nr:hypothetical protein [Sphingobacteriales bacterium]